MPSRSESPAKKLVSSALDLREPRPVGPAVEDEPSVCRRHPDVVDAEVRPEDPQVLTLWDELPLARHGQALRGVLGLGRHHLPLSSDDAVVRLAQLLPDRFGHARGVGTRMGSDRFERRLAEDRVIVVPPEDLVRQRVEILVDPGAPCGVDVVERDVVLLV